MLDGIPEAAHGTGDSSDHGPFVSTDNPLRAFLSGCFWIGTILVILSWNDIWYGFQSLDTRNRRKQILDSLGSFREGNTEPGGVQDGQFCSPPDPEGGFKE